MVTIKELEEFVEKRRKIHLERELKGEDEYNYEI